MDNGRYPLSLANQFFFVILSFQLQNKSMIAPDFCKYINK